MIDSSTLQLQLVKDNRSNKDPSFVGSSGALYIGTTPDGTKYLIKHTYPHNASNEFAACWLAKKIGAYTPKAYLLSTDKQFASPYAVAIEFVEGLESFEKDAVPNTNDLISQFALNILIYTDDILQMNRVGNRIISYDFSESFNMTEQSMRLALNTLSYSSEMGIEQLSRLLDGFRYYLHLQRFDFPGLAREFHLDPKEMRQGLIGVGKRVLDITEEELEELSDELCNLYPTAVAVYYEECIRAMQQLMNRF